MVMEGTAHGRSPGVLRPRNAAEACRMRAALGPGGVFIAGGTLLRTQWEPGAAAMPDCLIDLTAIPGLAGIKVEDGHLAIGSMTKLSELMRTDAVASGFPLLAESVRRIAAPSVRNLATIGGNVASRVGDVLPALLVYGAELIWQTGEAAGSERLEDWLGEPGGTPDVRLLTGIRMKLPDAAQPAGRSGRIVGAFRKHGRREAFIPPLVNVAVLGRMAEDGTLTDVRIAAGGGSAVPARLRGAEAVLEGARVNADALARLGDAVLREYRPASDAFAGAEYRRMAAANLIAAEWLKLAGGKRKGDGA